MEDKKIQEFLVCDKEFLLQKIEDLKGLQIKKFNVFCELVKGKKTIRDHEEYNSLMESLDFMSSFSDEDAFYEAYMLVKEYAKELFKKELKSYIEVLGRWAENFSVIKFYQTMLEHSCEDRELFLEKNTQTLCKAYESLAYLRSVWYDQSIGDYYEPLDNLILLLVNGNIDLDAFYITFLQYYDDLKKDFSKKDMLQEDLIMYRICKFCEALGLKHPKEYGI